MKTSTKSCPAAGCCETHTHHALTSNLGLVGNVDSCGVLARAVRLAAAGGLAAIACTASGPAPVAPAPPAPTPASEHVSPTATVIPANDARGARLYDNWRAEKKQTESFLPDASTTAELDGQGGPNGNGTLNDQTGRPLPNTGHDYRLKNLFGWDLRGAEGLYGATHQNKPYVLPHNLLTDARSPEQLARWLELGDAALPAFGQVLDQRDLTDLSAFLAKTREGELARPDQVFQLVAGSPGHYVLLPGGDAARGHKRFEASCSRCHGGDGRKIAIDENESVGTASRASAYEIWFKIQHGHPASPMGRQVDEGGGSANAQAILDLFAALCDRGAYPAQASGNDVPDGDARCADYLR